MGYLCKNGYENFLLSSRGGMGCRAAACPEPVEGLAMTTQGLLIDYFHGR
jgi:hypothetical protein